MRKFILSGVVSVLAITLILPTIISAHEGHQHGNATESFIFETQTVKNENSVVFNSRGESKYISGESTAVDERVVNDVLYAGNELVINNSVNDNVFFAGRGLQINGEVGGDVIFAGGALIVNGNVNGDIRAFGATIVLNSDFINGDVVINGGTLYTGPNLTVNGEQLIDTESIIGDETFTNLSSLPVEDYPGGFDFDAAANLTAISLGVAFLMLVGIIGLGYVILRFFPTFSEKTISSFEKDWLKGALVGVLLVLISGPLALLLIVSIVGHPLLLFLLGLAIIGFLMAFIYTRYYVGRLLLKKAGKDKTGRFIPLVVGILIIEIPIILLSLLPFVGVLLQAISNLLTIAGLGVIVLNKFRALRE